MKCFKYKMAYLKELSQIHTCRVRYTRKPWYTERNSMVTFFFLGLDINQPTYKKILKRPVKGEYKIGKLRSKEQN